MQPNMPGLSHVRMWILGLACVAIGLATADGSLLRPNWDSLPRGKNAALHPSPLVHVYVMTKNEEVMLPHTVRHYRTRFPGCPITVYDNNSTDKTVQLALGLGCTVRRWYTKDNMQDNVKLAKLKSECWKVDESEAATTPWVIVVDADEWLDMWHSDLADEEGHGSMIITTHGFAALGTSHRLDLSDIDMHTVRLGTHGTWKTVDAFADRGKVGRNFYSKSVCFKRGRTGLSAMNFMPGAHVVQHTPSNATLSSTCYVLKHMNTMGLPYFIERRKQRYEQALNSHKRNHSLHYTKGPGNAVRIYQHMTNVSTNWTHALTREGTRRLRCDQGIV